MARSKKIRTLLAHLDRLDHAERLATLAKHSLTLDARAAEELVDAFWDGGLYERRLALLVAWTRRELAPVVRALGDPSLSVRRMAAGLVGRYANTLPDAVADLDAESLDTLIGRVLRGRRPIAAALVDALIERKRFVEAARALSACPPETIEEKLDEVAWPASVWPRLARHAPLAMLKRVEAAFAKTDRPDLVWAQYDAAFWHALARSKPSEVADLVDAHADQHSLPGVIHAALTPLAHAAPDRVVGWLSTRVATVSAWQLPSALIRRLRTVDDAVLQPLCAGLATQDARLLARVLSRLPYPTRGILFEHAVADIETERIEWPVELLEVLPSDLCDRESARMLELERPKTDANYRRLLLGYRDVEAVRDDLEAECSRAQAVDRGEAYGALVRASGRAREGMGKTVALLAGAKNDQDPVRLAILTALGQVPVGKLHDADALDAVVAPIFEARDTSYATRFAASRLAHRLLVAHATEPESPLFRLGLSLLERLAGHAGTLDLPSLHQNLPKEAEHAIVEAILPWVEAAQKRSQTHMVFALWRALGKRAWRVSVLNERMQHAVWKGPKSHAGHAAALWVADPRTRDERVRELVRRDKSALYLAEVQRHCHTRRQTLLSPRFDKKPHRGRFNDLRVVPVPLFAGGFERWTPALEGEYVALVRSAMKEPKRFSMHRAILVRALARVPTVTVDEVLQALRPGDVVELEAALGALAWMDEPSTALPVLLDHLDGDRARVAAYALPRVTRTLPRDEVVAALDSVLGRPKIRVTVHKEVVRLLGRNPSARALELLRAEWNKELHRDVRIAALHAARSVLGEPEAWDILAGAASDPDADIARALVEVHAPDVPRAFQKRYLGVMFGVADHAKTDARNALFQSLRSWAAAAPTDVVELAARVVERLDLLDPWRLAVDRLADGARSAATHDTLHLLAQHLKQAAAEDAEPAGERDQLPRRRLQALVWAMGSSRDETVLEVLGRIADVLVSDPTTWTLGARARIAAASNPRLGDTIAALSADASGPVRVAAVTDAARSAASDEARTWTQTEATLAIDRLATGDVPGRLARVALLSSFGTRWGWGPTWTRPLAELRSDGDADVRTAARDVALE